MTLSQPRPQPLWQTPTSPEELNQVFIGTLCAHVGIKVTEVGDDFISATMPVDERTCQHTGILHGGGSVVLAETLGGVAANLCCKPGYLALGLDINANHLRAGIPPYVSATARPLHVGNTTSVWEIKITDIEGRLTCISRLTMAVIKKRE